MNRYIPAGVESEYQPGSRGRVLRNRRGIRGKREMDREEFELLFRAQEIYAQAITIETVFSAKLICQMHADWLGSLYSWAGRYRSVNVSKGGFAWPPASLVANNMARFEQETLRRVTPSRERNADNLALILAEVQSELLLVHPFREGNGRTARWLTNLMAGQAGFPDLDYAFTGAGKRRRETEYLNGVIAGYARDYERLARLLRAAIFRGLERAEARDGESP